MNDDRNTYFVVKSQSRSHISKYKTMKVQYYKYQHNMSVSQHDTIRTCLRTSRARLSNTCCSSISSCCARWISRVAPMAPSWGAPERRSQPTDILLNFAIHRGTKNQRRKYSTLYRYMRPATCNKTLWNVMHHILQPLCVNLQINESECCTSNLTGKWYHKLNICTWNDTVDENFKVSLVGVSWKFSAMTISFLIL